MKANIRDFDEILDDNNMPLNKNQFNVADYVSHIFSIKTIFKMKMKVNSIPAYNFFFSSGISFVNN